MSGVIREEAETKATRQSDRPGKHAIHLAASSKRKRTARLESSILANVWEDHRSGVEKVSWNENEYGQLDDI